MRSSVTRSIGVYDGTTVTSPDGEFMYSTEQI